MPLWVLPAITLFGPIRLPNVLPTRCTPLWPFAIAAVPVELVPIMLFDINVAARVLLNSSMPLSALPEMTLSLIVFGCRFTSTPARLVEKLLMSTALSGCTGSALLRLPNAVVSTN